MKSTAVITCLMAVALSTLFILGANRQRLNQTYKSSLDNLSVITGSEQYFDNTSPWGNPEQNLNSYEVEGADYNYEMELPVAKQNVYRNNTSNRTCLSSSCSTSNTSYASGCNTGYSGYRSSCGSYNSGCGSYNSNSCGSYRGARRGGLFGGCR